MLAQLVFDDNSVSLPDDSGPAKDILVNFVTQCLFVHQGPIHMLKLSNLILAEPSRH